LGVIGHTHTHTHAHTHTHTQANGMTALHLAARYGHGGVAEALLKAGCNKDMLDKV
jgi:ankyrin repeat protein